MSSYQPPRRPMHAASAEELAAQRSAQQWSGAPGGAPQEPVQQTPSSPVVEQQLPAVMKQTTGLHWPQYVNRHRLIGALLAGFFATHIADMFGYWGPMFGLPKLDFPTFNGMMLLTEHSALAQWVSGFMFHSMNGMVFALGYALILFPLLGKTLTTGRNVARGLLMGLTLATLSLAWWMPGNLPEVGIEPGTFSLDFGLKTVLAVYVWHVVWALGLGFIFNPQD